jgi:hypothetical protein
MAIVSYYGQYHHAWVTNNYADWSHDVEMPPSSVLCTSQLASYSAGLAGADTGFSQYSVRNPDTGVDAVVSLGGTSSPELVGLIPAFSADNCDSVTFWFHVEDGDGNGVIAMALFNIFYWG